VVKCPHPAKNEGRDRALAALHPMADIGQRHSLKVMPFNRDSLIVGQS
jgi:hypothetical protein